MLYPLCTGIIALTVGRMADFRPPSTVELLLFPFRVKQHTRLELVLSVWKTDVLTANTNAACNGLNGPIMSGTPYTEKEK